MKMFIMILLLAFVPTMMPYSSANKHVVYTGYKWGTVVFCWYDGYIGWIDEETGFQQNAIYESVDPLNKLYYIICSHGKYGIESKSGNILVDPVWSAIYPSRDFKHDHMVFLYSKSQTVVFDLQKEQTACIISMPNRLRGFYDGYALIRKQEQEWDIIDKEGQLIRSFDAINAEMSMEHYILIFNQNGYYITDLYDKAVNQTSFLYMSQMHEGIAMFETKDEKGQRQIGLINEYGDISYLPSEITSPYDYVSDGLLCFSNNGYYGFWDIKSRLVISTGWEYALPFSDGLALIKQDGKYGYINTDGNVIIPAQYDDATPFVNGRAIIEQCGTPDIIDDRGNSLLIENDIFDLIWISDTNKDLYIGRMDSSGEAYYITSEGNLICPYTPWSDSVYEYLDVED